MLCPQGPVQTPVGPQMVGYGWFPITMGGPLDLDAFRAAARQLTEFLDEAQRIYPIDPNRLLLLGFSQGGMMAYDFFLREPARFAGLVALSSRFSPELGSEASPDAKQRPVFVAHGTGDELIKIDAGRASREQLLELGLNLTYREYEMGHEINIEVLRELMQWLDDKVWHPIKLA